MVLGLVQRSDAYNKYVRPILSQQHSSVDRINLRFFCRLFQSNGIGMYHGYTYCRPMSLTSEKIVEQIGDNNLQNVPFYSLRRVILAARRICLAFSSGVGLRNLAHKLPYPPLYGF